MSNVRIRQVVCLSLDPEVNSALRAHASKVEAPFSRVAEVILRRALGVPERDLVPVLEKERQTA